MLNLESYPILAENTATFMETSKDDSDKNNVQYMTKSRLRVIDFDEVKRRYTNAQGLSEDCVTSVDAIVQFGDHIIFVEFKNGKVNNRNIKDKARDSLLLFSGITGESIAYTQQKVDFIVVYNLEKNPHPNQLKKEKLQQSPSRIAIGSHFTCKAKKELILFDLERYEKIYFRKVHTYSKEQFEEYLRTQNFGI